MPDNDESDNSRENRQAEARERLASNINFIEHGAEMLRESASKGPERLRATIRGTVPLLEAFSGLRAKDVVLDDDVILSRNEIGLDQKQMAVLNASAGKVLTQMIEIASVSHGNPDKPYLSVSEQGVYQPPHLMHLAALWSATASWIGFGNNESPFPGNEYPDRPGQDIEDQVQNNRVAYLAVAPGEFIETSNSIDPTSITRASMRYRRYSQPPLAIMSDNTQPVAQPLMMRGATGGAVMMPLVNRQAAMAVAPASAGQMQHVYGAHGCNCGRGSSCTCGPPSSCGCGGGSSCSRGSHAQVYHFPPARYEVEEPDCKPIWSISCETQWRIRECFKVALCDMLRCLADQACDDDEEDGSDAAGNPNDDEINCGEVFLCSLLKCLPEAICPPPKKTCGCQPAMSCNCNFAVGE